MPIIPAIGAGLAAIGGGSAIAGAATLATAAGGVMSALGAGKQAKAAQQAADMQDRTAQEQIALQREIWQQQRADNEPFRQIGLSAAQAVAGGMGLGGARPMSSTGRTSVIAGQGFGGYGSTPVPNVGGVSMTGRATGGKTPGGNAGVSPYETQTAGGDPSTRERPAGVSRLPPSSPDTDGFRGLAGPVAEAVGGVTGSPGGAQGGGPDWNAYLQANPDVAQEYQRARASADPNSPAFQRAGLDSPEHFAQVHYERFGRAENRPLPTLQGTPQQPGQPGQPAGGGTGADDGGPAGYDDPTVAINGGYTVGARPDPGPGPAPYVAPQRQEFGPAPVRQEYAPLNIGLDAYHTSPGYEWQQREAARITNSGAAATGRLMSGSRLKALQDRAQNIADLDYTDWRNYTTGQYNTDRGRADNLYTQDRAQYDLDRSRADSIYADDRGFGYGLSRDARGDFETDRARSDGLYADDRDYLGRRYDTRNSTLLTMAGFGTGANTANANAAQTFAQNAGTLAMTGARARGDAAIQGANAWAGLGNNLLTGGLYLAGRTMTGGRG